MLNLRLPIPVMALIVLTAALYVRDVSRLLMSLHKRSRFSRRMREIQTKRQADSMSRVNAYMTAVARDTQRIPVVSVSEHLTEIYLTHDPYTDSSARRVICYHPDCKGRYSMARLGEIQALSVADMHERDPVKYPLTDRRDEDAEETRT